ncbi:TlpA family protein disulfide reductase [Mucilaginibacter sp. P19]|uniref:TlpA family protein disulfide reductase n=1 Tax=Mucilaginibacter sp. P19 TaxID=3423947 RepID=UPI003D665698
MKMRLLKIIPLFLLALSVTAAYSQKNTQVAKKAFLKIGDKLPDVYFKVSNYKTPTIRLSNLKQKLILLDLWGTYCGTCIDYMPKVEQLQKRFRDSIQVIMVTKNSDNEVKQCAIRAENVKNNQLPFINGKERLAGYFNLTFVPQYVWINDRGIIKNISEENDVTDVNVRKFISGNEVVVKRKDTIPNPDSDIPLIVQMYPYLGKNLYIQSYLAPLDLTKYTTGSQIQDGLRLKKYKMISGNTFTFKELYKLAYGYSSNKYPLNNDRVILTFNDSAHFADPDKGYIYELRVNKNISTNRVLKHIQSELDLFFNVQSSLQKQRVTCLVFKKLNDGNSYLAQQTGNNIYDFIEGKELRVHLPWGRFVAWTNGDHYMPPHTLMDENRY